MHWGVFFIVFAVFWGAYLFSQWLLYWWADHQTLNARRNANTSYCVTEGDNIIRVDINPTHEMYGFYNELRQQLEYPEYLVTKKPSGLVWVGYPTNKYKLAAWSKSQYHEFVQGGERHGIPMQVQRMEFPFQPSDAELKTLNEKATRVRAAFAAYKKNRKGELQYLAPSEADQLLYMPSFRSKDGIETDTHVTVYYEILRPDLMINRATYHQDEVRGLIIPEVRATVAELELMNIGIANGAQQDLGDPEKSKESAISFERGRLLHEGQENLRKRLGVVPGTQVRSQTEYRAIAEPESPDDQQKVRSRVLRDWGILIVDVVIRDAQEVSGAIEKAAEAYKTKLAEQAGELVAAKTNRMKLILEGEGRAKSIELVGAAQKKAAELQIAGFSGGEKPTEEGRQAFLRWFETEAHRQGMTTSGRTAYLQLPTQFAPYAAMFEELRSLLGPDLAKKLKQLKDVKSSDDESDENEED